MKFHKYPQEEPEGNVYNKNNFLCKVLGRIEIELEIDEDISSFCD